MQDSQPAGPQILNTLQQELLLGFPAKCANYANVFGKAKVQFLLRPTNTVTHQI